MDIDFVNLYVNASDPEWERLKSQYEPFNSLEIDSGECRYRDWGFLTYWFRSVEENAPWVHKIHLVVSGSIPDFLKLDHPKLHIVKHEDYLPPEYLPTFSSHVLENNLHRIQGLSEHFVYFNDDLFLNAPIMPDAFFRDGLPKYHFLQDSRKYWESFPRDSGTLNAPRNVMKIINQNFSRKEIWGKNPGKIFSRSYDWKTNVKNFLSLRYKDYTVFSTAHIPNPMLKSTYEEVWKSEYEVLHNTSLHKFRHPDDVNQYLFRFWNLARGNFYPTLYNNKTYSMKTAVMKECVSDVLHAEHQLICFNDNEKCDDFEKCKREVLQVLEKRYPNKSSFEK